ncbi:class I SAM-dependent methyltransferase [Actinomadura logoneensis]|uniref:Class I SAM-dependent methyltransferase n=1 Tax=Actinomadura logoneensis TaxID=2293572 RepID=A0A372JSM7_9ACTN|nr:class I SAM-dependent methyltransferase [Actinomadura logoneensis]RFU43032.1 class I SAM-dependent methyltransferase [Actinomadura logoneensis]
MDARGWDERYSGRDLVWSAGPNRFVAEECAGLPPGRALDLACGEGRNALWLAGEGWTVTAVDFSAVAIERARELAEARGVSVELLVEDVLTWVPPEGAFDLVVIAYLQLPEMGEVLARAASAVAPGGVLVFVGHDRTNLTEGVGGPQDPAVLHTPGAVAGALPGLTVQRAERVRRAVEVDGEERFAVDTLVRAVRAPRR